MRKTSNMQGNNFVTDATGASNFGLADRSTLTTGSGKSSSQLLSYLGRINYSFLDKYMVTATYRIDGSSRFGEGNRFRSEEHTSELQSRGHLVCRLLLENKKQTRDRER